MFGCVNTIDLSWIEIRKNFFLPFYRTNPPLHHNRNDPRDKTNRKLFAVRKRYDTCVFCVVGWFVFDVSSTLCCWLGDVCVLCLLYTVLWVGVLCSVSLLHCVVGWSVFVFCVPSSLCCWIVSDCVLCPFYTVLWVGVLCSVSLLHCVVGWSVVVFCVPSTLCCWLVCDCVLCPFYTV